MGGSFRYTGRPAAPAGGLFYLLLLLCAPSARAAPRYYTYIGSLDEHSALLAWGTTDGVNTIGRSSPSHGKAVVEVSGRPVEESSRNWMLITGLQPDTEYPYRVLIKGGVVGEGRFRTWAAKASRLVFFVIGDYGTGSMVQHRLARVMSAEFEQRARTSNPVRFVLTTGDNIYGTTGLLFRYHNTGASDKDWSERFFEPYESVLKSVPFYATLGNHDGNETEAQADLTTYLDNFFFSFPEDGPRRYYRFNYGGLAEFFALDSTTNSATGPARLMYAADGEQARWLGTAMETRPAAPWRIAYFHHPPFSAGPRHAASRNALRPLIGSLEKGGVRVVFNGHEHNFQFSKEDQETGRIQYVVSGAGGELRTGSVTGNMNSSHIAGWAAQHHFLIVEIEGKIMHILPRSYETMNVVDSGGRPVAMPLTVSLP